MEMAKVWKELRERSPRCKHDGWVHCFHDKLTLLLVFWKCDYYFLLLEGEVCGWEGEWNWESSGVICARTEHASHAIAAQKVCD